jgi:hypothetical protein
MNKGQRKAMLIRRKWRRIREKRTRALVKLTLKKGDTHAPRDG